MNFKVFIINVLIVTILLTIFFPFKFSENPGSVALIGGFAISFHIYLFFMVIANLFLSAISFVTDDVLQKLTSSRHLLIEVIIRFCILGFIPIIISLFISAEMNNLLLMTFVTVLPYALLKTCFSGRIQKYDTNKIMGNIYYYSLIILIALFVLTSLTFGFVY